MKLEAMSVTVTPFKNGVRKNVGNWSFVDNVDGNFSYRQILHHGTLMGEFYTDRLNINWGFAPLSTGWGSASDQMGMNKILKDFGWTFRRNGGEPRFEHVSGRKFPN
jgi:hypothetical protein